MKHYQSTILSSYASCYIYNKKKAITKGEGGHKPKSSHDKRYRKKGSKPLTHEIKQEKEITEKQSKTKENNRKRKATQGKRA